MFEKTNKAVARRGWAKWQWKLSRGNFTIRISTSPRPAAARTRA